MKNEITKLKMDSDQCEWCQPGEDGMACSGIYW